MNILYVICSLLLLSICKGNFELILYDDMDTLDNWPNVNRASIVNDATYCSSSNCMRLSGGPDKMDLPLASAVFNITKYDQIYFNVTIGSTGDSLEHSNAPACQLDYMYGDPPYTPYVFEFAYMQPSNPTNPINPPQIITSDIFVLPQLPINESITVNNSIQVRFMAKFYYTNKYCTFDNLYIYGRLRATNNPTTAIPTTAPPTAVPTTNIPTTSTPTAIPTTIPTTIPTAIPTTIPTAIPTTIPTTLPTTSVPTTNIPTTNIPTTSLPSTSNPTTSTPTTSIPTTTVPTTNIPTTSLPTTSNPTSIPTTTVPTTSIPTTAIPTTSNPTTLTPTTAVPTTNIPTSARPTTNNPTTASPTTYLPTINPTSMNINPTTYNPTTNHDQPTVIINPTKSNEGMVGSMQSTEIKSGVSSNDNNTFFETNMFIIVIAISLLLLICVIGFILYYYINVKRRKKSNIYVNKENIELERINSIQSIQSISIATATAVTGDNLETDEKNNNNGNVNGEVEMGNIYIYSNENTLKIFLTNLELDEYYELFVAEGFGAKLSMLYELNDDDLKQIGINKMADRKLILKQIYLQLTKAKDDNFAKNKTKDDHDRDSDDTEEGLFAIVQPSNKTLSGPGVSTRNDDNGLLAMGASLDTTDVTSTGNCTDDDDDDDSTDLLYQKGTTKHTNTGR